jgi:hypothetical protein
MSSLQPAPSPTAADTLAELERVAGVALAEIPLLTPGRIAIVEAADAIWLRQFRWYFSGHRYAAAHLKSPEGKRHVVYMHRMIIGYPMDGEIDHVDGEGLHNWRANLRHASVAQNQWNRPAPKSNTSGAKGVSFISTRQRPAKWHAWIEVNRRVIHLGYYRTFEEAAAARRAAEIEAHGDFRHAG